MTNLTDKWIKGELPSGWYWVDYYSVDGAVMLEYIPQHNGFGYEEKELVQAVLAEVPSFEEYQKLLSNQLAKNEGVEINAELNEENTKLKTENKWYSEQLNEASKEIEKLKEQLKECELWFTGVVGNMNDKNVGEHNRNLPIGNFEHIFKVFSQKINQVLGEE